MDLISSINTQNILVNNDAKTKDEALRNIIHSLYLTGNVTDEELFLKDVYAREAEGVTGIGNGVAIPHGKGSSVVEPGFGIATLTDPIEWESLDDEKIKIVVLFAVSDSKEGAEQHLRLLSQFARKLGNDDVLAALKEAKNIDEVIEAFEV
ncbi:PTS sugar transporter subunit IIA [Paucilactobacillus kaifaensis]|uniref:PTS sugar transporter subunit IIA n=1 Tax=Paucilactobacillus kaifaensis TaxID=2559921 RepID=UPI0010F58A41|nr:fructose PTS transporter subunit IIA [Paucilactobacillus kaifaensis]